MPRLGIGLTALCLAVTVAGATPASAEFFGCNDRPGRVLYSYTGTARASAAAQYTRHLASKSRAHHAHATNFSAKRYWHER